MEKKTAILLATYNGARYIKEQIESIYAQTYCDWTIYAHDDGSTDGTKEILDEYANENGNFIVLDYPSQKGAMNNFLSLLKRVDADYYFFADQDDVWMPTKIEECLQRMEEVEGHNKQRPVLVCCDVCVTDSNLCVTSSSLWEQTGTHPEYLTSFDESAATPFVTGCTMLINAATKSCVLWNKTRYATMHDAFITLCVLKAKGIVSPIYKSLMYYRQHADNTLGAFSSKRNMMLYRLTHIKTVVKTNIALLRMLHALDYGSIFKFLKYKHIYKLKCRQGRKCK